MEWILTDESPKPEEYTQYVKQLSPTSFHVVEHDTDSLNGPQRFYGHSKIIDLNDYSEEKIMEYLKPYGYTERQDPLIEAECIAEQSMELEIYADTFKEIIAWEKEKGIITPLD